MRSMISLKATSISRSLELILLLLAVSLPLHASYYRVALAAEDESYRNVVLDVLSALSGPVTNEDAAMASRMRLETSQRYSRESTVSGYLVSEDSEKLESYLAKGESPAYDGTSVMQVVDVSLSDVEKEYLLMQDPEALEYILLRDSLDMLILAVVRDEGQVLFSDVYANGERCFSSAYLPGQEEGEFNGLLHALLPYFKSRAEVVVHVDAPGTVALTVDGVAVSPVRRTLVLPRGQHLIRYTSYSYEPYEEEVSLEDGTVLSPRLTPVYSGPVFLSSVPYDARIYYQGEQVEEHVTENGTVPFVVTAVREGFALQLLQSTVPQVRLTMELKPAWTDSNDVLETAKRRFYDSLLGTLVAFGCYAGSLSLENIYPDDQNFPAVAIAFTGLSLLQLVEMVDAMFGYYQAAKLGF